MEQGRLITFGCSFTFGHGLPDCIDENGHALKSPSKLGWPNILSSLLDCKEVCNESLPGASNKHILSKIMMFDFKKGDIPIILWTRKSRHSVFKDYKSYVTYMLAHLKRDSKDVYWNTLERSGYNVNKFKKNTITYFSDFYEEFDASFEQVVRMNYVHSYLESKNIKSYHLMFDTELDVEMFKHMMLPNINYHSFKYKVDYKIDEALDNSHPGIKSQQHFAINLRKWFFK